VSLPCLALQKQFGQHPAAPRASEASVDSQRYQHGHDYQPSAKQEYVVCQRTALEAKWKVSAWFVINSFPVIFLKTVCAKH
jgi:hypothetical protein